MLRITAPHAPGQGDLKTRQFRFECQKQRSGSPANDGEAPQTNFPYTRLTEVESPDRQRDVLKCASPTTHNDALAPNPNLNRLRGLSVRPGDREIRNKDRRETAVRKAKHVSEHGRKGPKPRLVGIEENPGPPLVFKGSNLKNMPTSGKMEKTGKGKTKFVRTCKKCGKKPHDGGECHLDIAANHEEAEVFPNDVKPIQDEDPDMAECWETQACSTLAHFHRKPKKEINKKPGSAELVGAAKRVAEKLRKSEMTECKIIGCTIDGHYHVRGAVIPRNNKTHDDPKNWKKEAPKEENIAGPSGVKKMKPALVENLVTQEVTPSGPQPGVWLNQTIALANAGGKLVQAALPPLDVVTCEDDSSDDEPDVAITPSPPPVVPVVAIVLPPTAAATATPTVTLAPILDASVPAVVAVAVPGTAFANLTFGMQMAVLFECSLRFIWYLITCVIRGVFRKTWWVSSTVLGSVALFASAFIGIFIWILTPPATGPANGEVLKFTHPWHPTVPKMHRYVFVCYQYFFFVTFFLTIFDMLLWPTMMYLATSAGMKYLNLVLDAESALIWKFFLGNVSTAIFFLENPIYAFLIGMIYRFRKVLLGGFRCSLVGVIYEAENQIPESATDTRPHSASFGKIRDGVDYRRYEEREIYSYENRKIGFVWNYYTVVINRSYISYSSFCHLTASVTTRLEPPEFSAATDKNLEKQGIIGWDKMNSTQFRVVSNTARAVKSYHCSLLDQDYTHDLKFLSWESTDVTSWVPWWWRGFGTTVFRRFLLIVSIVGITIASLYGFWLWLGLVYYLLTHLLELVFGVGALLMDWTVSLGTAMMVGANAQLFAVVGSHNWTDVNRTLSDPLFKPVAHNGCSIGVFGYNVDDPFCIFTPEAWMGTQDSEVKEPNPTNPNKNLKIIIRQKREQKQQNRKLMATFSPGRIPGIAMPMANRDDSLNFVMGMVHRGAGMTPDPDPDWTLRKQEIVQELFEAFVTPVDPADVPSVEEALLKTNYGKKQRDDIQRMEDDAHPFDKTFNAKTGSKKTAALTKEEPYSEWKFPRTIQGMHLHTWMSGIFGSLGRYVKLVEKKFYDLAPSVKGLNPQAQLKKILELGPCGKTGCDYSSYESSFSRMVQEAAQFKAYDYVLQLLPDKEEILDYLRWAYGKAHDVRWKDIMLSIENLKCSGDFDTAFSNFFDNVATWLTVFDKVHGVHWTDAIDWIMCEGDDNITDDHGFEFLPEHFAKLGMTAKIDSNQTLETAGFCQKYVCPLTGDVVGDPVRYLGRRNYMPAKYGLCKIRKKWELMRASAMSTLATYPNAPVISEHAWRIYELTKGLTISKQAIEDMASWGVDLNPRQLFQKPIISEENRLMVSYVFDFTMAQQRLFTEAVAKWDLGPLVLPLTWFPENWAQFDQEYATKKVDEIWLGTAAVLTDTYTNLAKIHSDGVAPRFREWMQGDDPWMPAAVTKGVAVIAQTHVPKSAEKNAGEQMIRLRKYVKRLLLKLSDMLSEEPQTPV